MTMRFYRIIKEEPNFARIKLTKLGHLDSSIEQIHTFKDDQNRFIRIKFNKEPSNEVVQQLDKHINLFGQLEVVNNDEGLEDLFISCLPRQGNKKYLLYFDRSFYTRVE